MGWIVFGLIVMSGLGSVLRLLGDNEELSTRIAGLIVLSMSILAFIYCWGHLT